MSILTITALSHMYDSKVLFDGANLSVNNGEHCGIVGLNGAGKTTFMNIIAGRVLQDEGEIRWLPGIRWGYLDQHADIDRTKTVMEYLESSFSHLFETNAKLEAMYREMGENPEPERLETLIEKSAKLMDYLTEQNFFELEAEIKKVANGLGINAFGYDTPIAELSGGQRARLMLANLLLNELDVMLLDEPTNFLDVEHVEWLKKYLDAFKGTFLLISHDVDFLNAVCKVIINVENRTIRRYTGNYDTFAEQREQNAKQYADAFERQQRDIKRMEEYIAKNKARASTAGMANSRKKMLDRIEVLAKPVEAVPATFHFPYVLIHSKEMLVADRLEIGYNGVPLLPPIDLQVTSETKLWIRGTNGIGKTTLLRTLMGEIPKVGGEYRFNINCTRLYLEQDLRFGGTSMNAMGFMNEKYPRMNQKEIRSELAKAGIKSELATKPLGTLSGGEQVKVKLCALTKKPSNFLLLDEPTNHLDVLAKEALAEAIEKYEGAVILVSHEAPFAERVCNDVFHVEK